MFRTHPPTLPFPFRFTPFPPSPFPQWTCKNIPISRGICFSPRFFVDLNVRRLFRSSKKMEFYSNKAIVACIVEPKSPPIPKRPVVPRLFYNSKEFCRRCRSNWIFSCPQKPNLSPNSKRIRLTKESESSDNELSSDYLESQNPPYFYRWCGTCETFHSLDWFYNPDFHRFDIECFRLSQPRFDFHVRELPVSSLPRDSRVLLAHMQQYYKRKSRFFSRLVRNEMPRASSAFLHLCCLCQKPIDTLTDSKADALPRSQLEPR